MRDRGRVGVLATAVMALSAFEIVHGRNARMYAELELLGVGLAILAEAWLRAPRRRHAVILFVLVLAGLLTHVSMFLVGAGLFVLAGRRRDRDAWRWRGAIVGAGAVWAVLWGPAFLVQTQGGHSDWIPRTTPARVVDTVASLVTNGTPPPRSASSWSSGSVECCWRVATDGSPACGARASRSRWRSLRWRAWSRRCCSTARSR